MKKISPESRLLIASWSSPHVTFQFDDKLLLFSVNYSWVLPSCTSLYLRNFWFPVWHVRHLEVIIPIHTTRKKSLIKTIFPIAIKELQPEGKLLPPKFEQADRQIQKITTHQSINSRAEPLREPVWRRKTSTVNDELLESQCGQVWEWKTPRSPVLGGSHSFVSFTWRRSPTSSHGEDEKHLLVLPERRRGKVATVKYTRSLCS